MLNKRIAIRTDANAEIGTGHFMRCLTLADELKKNGNQISFVTRGLPSYLTEKLQERNINLYFLKEIVSDSFEGDLQHSSWLGVSQQQDAMMTLEALADDKFDWLIVDHYALDYRWESKLRVAAKNILVIDDLADRNHDCDVLLDQNYYHDQSERYISKVPQHCNLLLGPSYALLRDEFREERKVVKPRDGSIKNLLIYFGGADAKNFTSLAINSLIRKKITFGVDVVIGKLHPNIEEIQDYCNSNGFSCHVQSERMAELMAGSDMALCAGGSSVWELFAMGLPSICMSTASNQSRQLIDLQVAGLVISPHQGQDINEFLNEVWETVGSRKDLLREISTKTFQMVDGNGVHRVSNLIAPPKISMRVADHLDTLNIFTWRNHPTNRSHSISTSEISWSEHKTWFDHPSRKANQPILIGETKSKPVGVVRFDIGKEMAEVSIYLVQDSGNSGLGRSLLSEAECWVRAHYPTLLSLRAKVLEENVPSKKLFQSLGYVQQNNSTQIEFFKNL